MADFLKHSVRGRTVDARESGLMFTQRTFLLLGCPVLLLYCFLIGPFEASDEASHFRRITAIASGQFLPILDTASSNPTSAGGKIDENFDQTLRSLDDVVRNSELRFSRAQMKHLANVYESGNEVYSAHSNTAIYPPVLYAPSALSFFVLGFFDFPILVWLYIGRLANAIVATLITLAAIRRSADANLFVTAVAMLPLVLFQEATLSADALLLPLFLLFSVLTGQLARGVRLSRSNTTILIITSFVLCIGKVAYLPLGILPPLASWYIDHRFRGRTLVLLAGFFASIIAWLVWAHTVQNMVFSIRPNVVVDAAAQLQGMINHPLNRAFILARSAAEQSPNLIIGMVGRRLGWQEIVTPLWLVLTSLIVLTTMSLFSPIAVKPAPSVKSAAIFLSVMCAGLIFVLLYLQYNAVGNPAVEGVQGRYFTPLLMILLCLAERRRVSFHVSLVLQSLVITWAILSNLITAVLVANRYWLPLA